MIVQWYLVNYGCGTINFTVMHFILHFKYSIVNTPSIVGNQIQEIAIAIPVWMRFENVYDCIQFIVFWYF